MTSGEVLVQVDDDVLRVTVNRPEKRNPLSRPVLAAIGEAFRIHRDRRELRLGLVTAVGTKSFAAGGGLREVESIREIEASRQFSNESYAALDEIRRFPVPVIAALNGDALGGGAELAATFA
jgi:enoyl-CoA hydratase